MEVDYSETQKMEIVIVLLALNIICLVFVCVSGALDRSNKLIYDQSKNPGQKE
jgi:hypothetical protein